jgi:hypothetical protein
MHVKEANNVCLVSRIQRLGTIPCELISKVDFATSPQQGLQDGKKDTLY